MSTDNPAARCSAIASTQHGTLHRVQAFESGMTRRMIDRCLDSGLWSVLYPNVYILGGTPLSWLARVKGATLGEGPICAASHRSAARLLRLDGFTDQIVEITSARRIRWDGVIGHRGPAVLARDVRQVNGIPTTTATHTLIGLGSVVGDDRLEAALDSSLIKGLTSLPYLVRRIDEVCPGNHRGTRSLKRLVTIRLGGQAPTESELERLFHRNVTVANGLPLPQFQFRVQGAKPARRIDFAYPDVCLGIEVLGWKVHGGHRAWHRDLERHNQLTNLGWEMLYFPWLEVLQRPKRVPREIEAALRRRTTPAFGHLTTYTVVV